MPIYEYKCTDCNNHFEILHRSITKIEDVSCPKCNSANIKKLMSTFAPNVVGGFSSKTSPAYDSAPSCDTGSCCGGGSCGLN